MVLCVCVCLLSTVEAYAQSPQLINYQAVARDSQTGSEIANQSVFLSVKILNNGPNGDIIYQEDHAQTTTNAFGLFNIQIGGGEAVSGFFDQIDWSSGSHWLEIDIDLGLGSGLETVGSMQFVSVPYALHAETVDNADDADADPANELISDVTYSADGATLTITEAGIENQVVLSELVDDADADPTNELISEVTFDETESTLNITEAGQLNSVDLTSLINDADSDVSNELITSLNYSTEDNFLTITENGNTFSTSLAELTEDADPDPANELINSVTLEGTTLIINEAEPWSVNLAQLIDDADPDPANELIETNGLVLDGDTMLQITEGGVLNEVNLAPLSQDGDWSISNDETTVYNTTADIGIGTSNPLTKFQVNGSVGYGISLIQSGGIALNYQVSDVDHIIVCKINIGTIMPITIDMPDPSVCQGRVITVRRTGPFPLIADVEFQFNGAEVDFVSQNIELDDVIAPQTISFLSLGADGWTELMTND